MMKYDGKMGVLKIINIYIYVFVMYMFIVECICIGYIIC